MTISHDWSLHLIRKAGGSPEQHIAASLIVTAREGCANGNQADCQWLEACAAAYLTLIMPPDVDEYDILARLLDGLPAPESARGWRLDSEQFIQMVLGIPEQEATDDHATDLPEIRTRVRDPTRGHPQWRVAQPALPSV